MKYFSKKRFSMKQVVFLLSLVIAGIAIFAYASTVTIPNTFTSGTTISSSQMNANFTAVKTAVDDNDSRITAVNSALPIAYADLISNQVNILDGAWHKMNQIAIDVPSDGILLITASVVTRNNSTTLTATIRSRVLIDDLGTSGLYPGYSILDVSDSKMLSFTASSPVTAGVHNVDHEFSVFETGRDVSYWIPSMNVVFIPSSQGTITSQAVQFAPARSDSSQTGLR